MITTERQLIYCCLLFRGLVLISQILLAPFPDHDADAFNPSLQPPTSTLDSILSTLFRGFRRWDAIYFAFIAHWGYVYEHCLAFFPLFPAILGLLSRLFYPFISDWLSLDTAILLVGITLNQLLAVLCTLQLYHLGLSVLKSPQLSWLAALLFCINPALVFFSTVYTESLFFLLTISALFFYERKSLFLSTLLFAFSISCRSNGLLNLGYIAFSWWSCSFGVHSCLIWNEKTIRSVRSSSWQYISSSVRWWSVLLGDIVRCLGLLLLGLLPFVIFQLFAYISFCPTSTSTTHWLVSLLSPSVDQSVVSFANVSNFRLSRSAVLDFGLPVTTPPVWCMSTLPLSYSHIQRTYWQVGFLTYYEWKQLPNFLLATPIVVISLGCVASFYAHAPKAYKTLGLRAETPFDCRLVPYVFHLLFLTVYGVAHINVQVLTRMLLSSCPIIYWYCAYLLTDWPPWEHASTPAKRRSLKSSSNTTVHRVFREMHSTHIFRLEQVLQVLNPMHYPHFKQRLLITYFLSYAVLGTILHVKFLPWT